MLYNKNKSCVNSCQNIAFKIKCFPTKPIVFQKKPIVFQHVHFLTPWFWNEKLSLSLLLQRFERRYCNFVMFCMEVKLHDDS